MMDEQVLVALSPLIGLSVLASLWGARAVPAEERFRLRFGGLGFDTTIGKRAALIVWPLTVAAVAGGAAVLANSSALGETGLILGIVPVLIVLLAQVGAIRRAASG